MSCSSTSAGKVVPPPGNESVTAAPIRLLLIEDNPDDARLVQAALAKHAPGQFGVTCAERLADALLRIGAECFDVVLCDLGLPDSTGIATAQAITIRAPALPLVVLTGSHAEDHGRGAIQHGAQEYLVKGESSGTLIARTLRYAMERKRLEIELRTANEALERRVAERTAELDTAIKNLRATEDRYRDLVENSQDLICTHDLEGKLLSVNAAAIRLTGYAKEALLSMNMADLLTRGASDGFAAYLDKIRTTGAARGVMHIRTARGEARWWEYHNTLRTEDVATPVVRGMAQDITDRKQAEEALGAAEEQFRGLVEQSIAGIYIIQDGNLIYVNPRCAEILGQGSTDEMIGKDPLGWVADADQGLVAENIRRLIDGEARSVALEFGALRRDGVTIRIGANAARASRGGRPSVIGVMQDISEKKRAEDEIQRYVAQLKTAFMSTVEVATTLSEMRDPYTAGHERRVGEIAVAIGAELGFDARRQEGLRVAGYLHDIGKMTIPAEILSKPGKLSPIETALIKGHPRASYDVLKDVEFPWPVARVALEHHERIDGSGYPQGLKGEAILLESRIMAVADVIEAMASHRPYRPGLGIDQALAEIERGRGTVYDPAVADACLRLFRKSHYQLSA